MPLGSHKSQAVRAAIRAAGARLFFLPPCTPDLNPIEQVFAKLKHLLRKAAERTFETTWKRIGSPLDCFFPDECQAYLANAGYRSIPRSRRNPKILWADDAKIIGDGVAEAVPILGDFVAQEIKRGVRSGRSWAGRPISAAVVSAVVITTRFVWMYPATYRELIGKIARARDQLLVFCAFPGEVEPTNNGSERALRPAVIQRKVSGEVEAWTPP